MLDWFDLSINNFVTIPEQHKLQLNAIEYVIIGGNPYFCDCSLAWLKEFYDRRRYQLSFEAIEDFEPQCSSPQLLSGASWAHLTEEYFVCDDSAEDLQDSFNQKAIFDPNKLTVKSGSITDKSFKLHWDVTGRIPCATIAIQYHKFAHRSTTLKFVEVSILQRGYTIKNLQPSSNYIVCAIPNINRETDFSRLSPLLVKHCVEITTLQETPPVVMTSYFHLFSYYIITMTSTLVVVLILIGACALVAGACANKDEPWSSDTAQIDQPIAKHSQNKRDEVQEINTSCEADDGIVFYASIRKRIHRKE